MNDLMKRARNNANHNCQLPAEDTHKLLDEIERLTALVDSCSARNEADVDRIAKLEAALQEVIDEDDSYYRTGAFIAQAALQEKSDA